MEGSYMAEKYKKPGPEFWSRTVPDLYGFTDNEKKFKKIFESQYGYLLMTPVYMDQLAKMTEDYPFLPVITGFQEMARNPRARAGRFTLQHLGVWDNSEIFMCRHERYSYPLIHTHSYVEALYVYDGSCRQLICGKTLELHKGDFCILSPNAPHCVMAYEDDNIILNFLIHEDLFHSAFFDVFGEDHLLARFFRDILYNNSASPYLIFPTGEDEGIRRLVLNMYQENYHQRRYYGSFMSAYFHEMMLLLLRNYETAAVVPSPIDTRQNDQIVAILDYIHVNYNHVTIKDLAAFFNYSESYLSKILKEYTGRPFSSLLGAIQMENAAAFLKNTEMTIQQVSQEVGCFDVSHFTKKFKKYFGVTPTAYRKLQDSVKIKKLPKEF